MEKSELKSNSNEKLSLDKHTTHEDNTSRSTVALDRWNKLLGSVGKIKAWNSKTGESASALITLPPRKNSKLRSEGGSSTSSSAASSPVPSRHSASPSKKLSPQLTALKSPLANLRKTRSSSISAMVPRRGSSPSNLLGATQMLSSSAATPSPLPSGDSFALVTRSLRRVKSERYDNSWDCPVFWHNNTQPRTTVSTPLLSSAAELDEIRRTVTSPAGLKVSDMNSAHDMELKNSSELLGQLKAISAQRSKSRRKIHRLKDKDKDKDKEKDKHKERRPRDSMLLSPSSSDSMDLSTPRDLSELITPRERSGTIDTHMLKMMQEMHADPNKALPKKLSRQDKESSAFNLHLATTVAQKSAAVDLVVPIAKHPYLDISRIEWGQRDEDETVRRFGLLTTSRSLASLTPRAVGENKIILAGNLTQLVNVAVNPHAAYENFLRIMVLTHRHVLSSHEFLDKLIRRYHIKPLKGQEDGIEFTHHKELLQEGVITMLQSWMDLHFDDFVGNEKVLESFQQFVHHLEKGSDKDRDFVQLLNRSMARQYRLLEDAERNLLKHTPLLQQFIETEMTLTQGASMTGPLKLTRMAPVPVNAVAVSSMSLLDFHPLELAKQLALREWSYFQRAEIDEYIHLRWTKSNKNKSAPNILQLIRRFNELSYWVASEIVSTVNKKKRVVVLTRFLQIAKYCRDMNNFQVVMAIYCGLNMQAIQRLRKTWKGVGKEHIALLKELDQLFEAAENYKHYRTRVRAAIDENQPVLPFQGVYLKSLVFIEENHDKTERGLLNVEKLEMLYKVLYEIRMCQRYPFPFTEVPQIQDYLTNLEAMTDDELYKNSKQCEENTSETPNQLRKSVKLKKKI